MEILINCNLNLEIESIENISGGNQSYEILVLTKGKERYKIIFDFVWDIRCSIEGGYIDRSSKFKHNEEEKSSILLIENSEKLKDFEKQLSGTRPTNNVKNFIIFDTIDTIIEILTLNNPILMKL